MFANLEFLLFICGIENLLLPCYIFPTLPHGVILPFKALTNIQNKRKALSHNVVRKQGYNKYILHIFSKSKNLNFAIFSFYTFLAKYYFPA